MKMNLQIDNKLLRDALYLNPNKTIDEVVEEALKLLVRVRKQGYLKKLKGKLRWEGDLEEMRTDK